MPQDPDKPRKPPDDQDRELFRRLTSGAKPLSVDTVAPPRRPRPARARFARRDERNVLRESLDADHDSIDTDNGDSLRYQQPSVSRKTMRRLARGGFSVQAEIDLHGLTADQAREALKEFIAECLRRNYGCVRIVHGKGKGSGPAGPVLKRRVDAWLRRWEPVLAYVSARPVDGGSGAVYVLLRRNS